MKRSIRTAAAGRRQQRSGFTLIELLVVVAIIALLVGVGGTFFSRMRESARQSLSQVLIEGIRMGVENYKSDMGEYPVSWAWTGSRTYAYPYDREQWYGAHFLAQAMLGQLDASDSTGWLDYHDGFGFRSRERGKVYGPYIDAKSKTKDMATGTADLRPVLLDGFGQPILYYRHGANPSAADQTKLFYFDHHNVNGSAG